MSFVYNGFIIKDPIDSLYPFKIPTKEIPNVNHAPQVTVMQPTRVDNPQVAILKREQDNIESLNRLSMNLVTFSSTNPIKDQNMDELQRIIARQIAESAKVISDMCTPVGAEVGLGEKG